MELMKKINKIFSYSLLILLLVTATFLSIPSVGAIAVTGTPTVTIDSPTNNEILNSTVVTISGTYSDFNVLTGAELQLTATDGSNNAITGTPTILDPTNGIGTWTFSTSFVDEGTHVVNIKIEKSTDNTVVDQKQVTFTIDTKRPYVSNTGIVLSDNSVQNGEDLTSVPKDAKIQFSVSDDQPMNTLVSKIRDTNNPYEPIKVILGTAINTTPTPLSGTTEIVDLGLQSGEYVYEITFTPSQPLLLNQTYLAYLDSSLLDDSNGPVYSKFFKFTTKTNTVWDDMDDENHNSSNPHGHYQLNTNMCASCHSSHVDSPYQKGITNQLKESREGGSYLIDYNEKLDAKASENYCTACHDGTLNNAPIVNGIDSTYHHDNPADYDPANGTNKLKEATSCTSCHNPHLEWSESNPDLLIDHYVYSHNAADQGQNGLTNLVVDSLEIACETCHKDDLIHNADNSVTYIYDSKSSNYQVLSYKKSLTSQGTITSKATDPNQNTVSDYALCLRCHNANKNNTDIEKYYVDTASGHDFSLPSEDGGSKLNGPLPCAECHNTHGSNNIKMLRTQLGNVLNGDKFNTTSKTWIASDERQFCLKCHNNNTEIYGKVGVYKETNSSNLPISGHQTGDTQACSSCHGTGTTDTEKALSAAHAPKKTITP